MGGGVAGAPTPTGNGLVRVASGGIGVHRFPASGADGTGIYLHGPGLVQFNRMTHTAAGQIVAGQTYYFQSWYRDIGGPCAQPFNFSNGVAVTFTP